MAPTLQQVRELAQQLPLDERMQLAGNLLEEIDASAPDFFKGHGEIFLLAVAHAKRDPGYWANRLPTENR